ncbi:hypothetical protein TrCOL_g6400 [Triparma columacea]|uniref:RRM domain-containing protein n=1 Tax=Triparma columacea TaxID=722753 RepID=A0A9W7GEA1_9STRA|nr:hypothetical protein TrCOL_g6400 [Triparma columacea]
MSLSSLFSKASDSTNKFPSSSVKLEGPRSFNKDDYADIKSEKKRKVGQKAKGERYVDPESGAVKVKGGKKRARMAAKQSSQPSDNKDEEDDKEVESEEAKTAADDDAGPSSSNDDEESRTVFVSNLDPSCTRKSLLKLFKSPDHPVSSCRIRGAPSVSEGNGVQLPESEKGNSSLERKVMAISQTGGEEGRVAYVVFETIEGMSKAVEKEWKLMDRLLYAVPVTRDATTDAELSVFVGNVPFKCTEEELRRHVEGRMGEGVKCRRARIVRDKDSRISKGCGYLLMETKKDVGDVLKAGLGKLGGKELRVEVCGKRTKKKKGETGGKKQGKGRENAKEGAGRRVLGKMKTKGRVGANEKSVPKRKARIESKGGQGGGGSKRKEREKKTKDRVKKIEKRIKTGMGAQKKKGRK